MLNYKIDYQFFEKTELRLIFRKLNREAKFRYSIFLQLLTLTLLLSSFLSLVLFFEISYRNQQSFVYVNLLLLFVVTACSTIYLLQNLGRLKIRYFRIYLEGPRYKENKEKVLLGSPAFMLITQNKRLQQTVNTMLDQFSVEEKSIVETLLKDQYRGTLKQLIEIAHKL